MTWTPEALREELLRVGATQLGWKELPQGDLADALDSVDRLALVVAVEDRFAVAFEPEDDARIRTLDDVVTLILEQLEGGGHG